jgi:sec-independent protein translocase protein TatA
MGIENPVHLLFLGGVALLVLGPKRLPEVARSLGRGLREFREAMSEGSAGAGAGQERPTTGARAESPVDPGESVRSGDAPDRRPL